MVDDNDAPAANSSPGLRFQEIQLAGGVSELTTLHRLQPGGAGRIRAFLDKTEPGELLDALGEVHFARWFVIDGSRLAFCAEVDGRLDDFFTRLTAGSDIAHNIWRHCVGCPAPQPTAELARFIAAGQIQTLACCSPYPTLSVGEIRKLVDWQKKFIALQKQLARPARQDTLAGAVGVSPDPFNT